MLSCKFEDNVLWKLCNLKFFLICSIGENESVFLDNTAKTIISDASDLSIEKILSQFAENKWRLISWKLRRNNLSVAILFIWTSLRRYKYKKKQYSKNAWRW